MTIDQRGAGNSQFGKRYTEDEKRVAAEKTRSLWRSSEYRERVVRGATGLKRSDEFRIGQRERTKASYEKVPGLRESRGRLFSRCWRDGRNHFHVKRSRKSVEEKEIYEHLKALGRYSLSDTEIRLTDGSFVAPDIVIDGKIAVEFYGDYYHANPFVYEDDDYIKVKGKTAKGYLCYQSWLDLDVEEEKPMNCPFCDSKCVCVINENKRFVVRCTNCDYTYGNAMEEEETVKIHNRVRKAVSAYKGNN